MARLDEATMRSLLTVRKEAPDQDYRRDLPPKGTASCSFLDLLKDIAAMANIGGGVIVFGVDDDGYKLVGLARDREKKPLDETDLRAALGTYFRRQINFELVRYAYNGLEFAFLAIEGVSRPLLFARSAECRTCRGRDDAAKKHFFYGSTFIRQGTSTVHAPEAWIEGKLIELQLLERESPDSERILNNLPTRDAIYDVFVGRAQQFEAVLDKLRDSRRRVTWIQGSGGIGKTALAYRIAEHVVAKRAAIGNIEYVVWISAKETTMTTSGIKQQAPGLTCVADIVASIKDVTGMLDISEQALAGIQTFRDALSVAGDVLKEPGLMILDNLETVKDQEILRLIQNLPGETRALATTRKAMEFIGEDTVILDPMSFSDAEDLTKTEAVRTGHSWIQQNDPAIESIVTMSGRIPLAIRLLVPRIDSHKALRECKKSSAQHQRSVLQFCYEGTYQALKKQERRCFFAIAMFEDGVSKTDLAFLLEVDLNKAADDIALQRTIERLWHYSLIVIRQVGAELRYECQPLVRTFVKSKLSRKVAEKQELAGRREALKRWKEGATGADVRKAKKVFADIGDYDTAMALLGRCWDRNPGDVDAWLCKADIELMRADHAEAQLAAMQVRANSKIGSREWLRGTKVLAKAEYGAGRLEKAEEVLQELVESNPDNEDWLLLSGVYSALALKMSKDRRELARSYLKEAMHWAERAVRSAILIGDIKTEKAGLSLWANAAMNVNPAIAYQAAQRALSLPGECEVDVRKIQDDALSELQGAPQKDLLKLPPLVDAADR